MINPKHISFARGPSKSRFARYAIAPRAMDGTPVATLQDRDETSSQLPDRKDRLTPSNLCNPGARGMAGIKRGDEQQPWTMRGTAAWPCSHNGGMLIRSILLADQDCANRGGCIVGIKHHHESAEIGSHIPGLWQRGWPPIAGICTPALDPSVPGCYGSSERIACISPLVYCMSAAAWSPEQATWTTTSPSTKPGWLPYSAIFTSQLHGAEALPHETSFSPSCQQEPPPTLRRHVRGAIEPQRHRGTSRAQSKEKGEEGHSKKAYGRDGFSTSPSAILLWASTAFPSLEIPTFDG
ncbi:hypothetical protein CCMA1212_004999 [Trichoderma ghanense]|uniref:Uncharacterized protein n=1 Tax=Trichoderma ghanense TaxID=65468 RepID=A0ABY2H5R2_9HYPO